MISSCLTIDGLFVFLSVFAFVLKHPQHSIMLMFSVRTIIVSISAYLPACLSYYKLLMNLN